MFNVKGWNSWVHRIVPRSLDSEILGLRILSLRSDRVPGSHGTLRRTSIGSTCSTTTSRSSRRRSSLGARPAAGVGGGSRCLEPVLEPGLGQGQGREQGKGRQQGQGQGAGAGTGAGAGAGAGVGRGKRARQRQPTIRHNMTVWSR